MSAGSSNTFTLPSQGSSIAVSRTQFNSSLRALLQNFYSAGTPSTDNLIESGAALSESEYNGMLYRNSTTGMLYISDSSITVASNKTNNPVGGKFTRYGIAWRQEPDLATAATNLSTYDVGEAFVVINDTAGSSNNRMYLRVSPSTDFSAAIIDVGKPAPGQVDATSFSNKSVSGIKLADVLARDTTLTITPRLVVNSIDNTQSTPTTAAMEITGGTVLSCVSLGFTTATNSSMIKQVKTLPGLNIESTGGALAPLRSNVILQTTITGSTSSTVAPLIPAGVIVAWAGSSAPDGWLLCDGAAISRSTYAALWALCGTNFGFGDYSTTFNLPNIKGRAIYGVSTGTINLADTSTAISASFAPSSSTTGSTTAGLSVTTSTTNQSTDKDVTNSITVVTGVTSVAHTHTTSGSLPGIGLNYIIKT